MLRATQYIPMYGLLLVSTLEFSVARAADACGRIATQEQKAATFDKTSLPHWWHNTLGTEPIVLPGYSPIKVSGNQIELYERFYNWNNAYLPNELISRGSPIANHMRLVANVNGNKIELMPDTVQTEARSEAYAEVFSTGEPLPGLRVQVLTRIEYDGVASSTIRLTPSFPVTLDGLDYEVQVPRSPSTEVIAFKANGIRLQKDRQDMITPPYAGEFLNAVGFADGDRSFWWFADNAKGWIWNGKTVTEIEQTDENLSLRQRLIGEAWTITEPMTFRINFLATPVRDLGTEWRSKRVVVPAPNEKEAAMGGKFKLWWTEAFAHDAFPYTYYPMGTEHRLTAQDRLAFAGQTKLAQTIKHDKTRFDIHLIPYFSAHVLSNLDPALNEFRPLWEVHPLSQFKDVVKPYAKIYEKPILTHQARSYSNYLLWRLDREIDNLGIEGIYFDHGDPYESCNPLNGGWIDSNGRLQPSLDIMGLREFLKRLRVLFHLKGKAGYVFIHNSNREIIPAYTFAYATVDGEQYRDGRVKWGDYLSAISLDELRTRFAPGQYGVLSIFLPSEWNYHQGDKLWQGSERQRSSYRRMIGLMLLHDIPDWPIGAHPEERKKLIGVLDEFGIDKATFTGYWSPDSAISADNRHVKVSSYYRPDTNSTLLIAVNTAITTQQANLSIHLSRIKSGAGIFEIQADSGGTQATSSTQDATVALDIPPREFRWIIINPADSAAR